MAMKTLSGSYSSDPFWKLLCVRLASPGEVFSCCGISSSGSVWTFLWKLIYRYSHVSFLFMTLTWWCFYVRTADSPVNDSFNSRVEPPTLLAAERKEAMSVLTVFLMQQVLSKAVAARTINKSDHFIKHLVSRLYSTHKRPVATFTFFLFFFGTSILVSLFLCWSDLLVTAG